jgi:hypothetical protein
VALEPSHQRSPPAGESTSGVQPVVMPNAPVLTAVADEAMSVTPIA